MVLGCFLMLFMSRKLMRRRMLPLRLFRGLLLPLGSASSARIRSALGLVMGARDCVFAPAEKERSSRKSSLSAANFNSALSKSKSPRKPPPEGGPSPPLVAPTLLTARIVALLLLLAVGATSRSSTVVIESRLSKETLDRRLPEFCHEWRAVSLLLLRPLLLSGLGSGSPSSAIVDSG